MTWPSWLPRVRLVKAATPSPAKPKSPPILTAFSISTALQPNNAKAGSRSIRRVCTEMQQRQYAIDGWNYACRFRS